MKATCKKTQTPRFVTHIEFLQLRVAGAEDALSRARQAASRAKRQRKLAKLFAKRAKKHFKEAKENLNEAREALARAEAKAKAMHRKRPVASIKLSKAKSVVASSKKPAARRKQAHPPVPSPTAHEPVEQLPSNIIIHGAVPSPTGHQPSL